MATETAGIGHNSGDEIDTVGIAGAEVLSFIERVERLEEEKKTISEDIRDVFGEAKGRGFDVKVLKEIVKIRKQDRDQRSEFETLLDLYMRAMNMSPGDAARATGMMD